MQVAERLQGNVRIGPENDSYVASLPLYPNLKHQYFPLFWVDKHGSKASLFMSLCRKLCACFCGAAQLDAWRRGVTWLCSCVGLVC